MNVPVEEVEDRAESPVSSCLSLKTDWSKGLPPDFSTGPGPSDTKVQSNRQRAESPVSGCLSLKTDWSKGLPPDFSTEPGPSDSKSQFWMDLFGDLRDSGLFNGSHEHQCLLRFCFSNVLQQDLDECMDLWNKHRIRPSRHASCPGGIPNELFLLPHRFGSRDCGFAVEDRELDVFPEARQVIDLSGDPEIEEYLQQAVEQQGLQQPHDWKTASELYITLKEIAGL